MQRHICSLQVSRMCGAHALSADHLTALYTAFTLHYEHGLNAFGIDMLPTDMGLSDAYALLAGELIGQIDFEPPFPLTFWPTKTKANIFLSLHSSRDVWFGIAVEDLRSLGGGIMSVKLFVKQ